MQNLDFSFSIQDYSVMNPGVFIDIDGVLLQGGKPFEWTKEAIHMLWNNDIPFCFVTNGTYCTAVLADNLSKILELPLTTNHVVVAPSPCIALTEYHDKHVLVCCQDDGIGLISELGFTDYITIPELVEIFPELDYVDHNRRKVLAKMQMSEELYKKQYDFRPIDVILLLGEPINWECHLQVLIDILMTNGDPRNKFKFVPSPHLPIIACNKDITFKGPAPLPRFGHGAFLECLEALYLKITKNDLVYEEVTGKPFMCTYEFSANQIQSLSKNGAKINKFYIVGDNPDVDVKGANVYKEHLQLADNKNSRRSSARSSRRSSFIGDSLKQNQRVESILVCTGVYNPEADLLIYLRSLFNATHLGRTDENETETEKDSDSGVDTNNNSAVASLNPFAKRASNASLNIEELKELKGALSRKNSFISYFDDKQNIPDVTVNNLKDACEYIVKSVKEMQAANA